MGEERGAGPPEAVALVVNPRAGGGKGAKSYAWVAEALRMRGVESARFETSGDEGDEPATTQALKAGFEEIWVVGGDGTVTECLAGIVQARGVLGVIPAGTSNCLALELGTPPEVGAAVEWLLHQPIGRIDLGRCNDQLFAVRMGIGLEASAARITERNKQGLGPLGYALAGIRAIREHAPMPMVVRTQGDVIYEGLMLTSIISNVTLHPLLRFLGRGRVGAADGLLHITVVEDAPVAAHLTDWLIGAAHGEPYLERITEHYAPEFHIDLQREIETHLDGQYAGQLAHLALECAPRHIKVRGGPRHITQQEG